MRSVSFADSDKDDGPFPYYLDEAYTTFFTAMHAAVRAHLAELEPRLRDLVWGAQGAFGSTGDFGPWHGEPTYPSGAEPIVTKGNWVPLLERWMQMMCDMYRPDGLALLFNQGNNDQGGLNDWISQNCPGAGRKAGNIAKGYQLNNEMDEYNELGRNKQSTHQ